jgi:hypothetical protein
MVFGRPYKIEIEKQLKISYFNDVLKMSATKLKDQYTMSKHNKEK